MRLYHIRLIGKDGSILHFWSRNMKDAKKKHTRLKRKCKESIDKIKLDSYEVPRNKDGIIDLLNNVT